MMSSSSASPFPVDPSEDHEYLHHHQFNFLPNYPSVASSTSSLSCHHAFFNSSDQDQAGYNYYRTEVHHQIQEDENHMNASYHVMGSHDLEKKAANKSGQLKLSLNMWKNCETQTHDHHDDQENQVKWMPSKMRLMQRMRNNKKKSDRNEINSINTTVQPGSSSSPDQTHEHLSSSSNNSSTNFSYHNSTPIRVCADCNTTKTPLWRSGPKGPKSLCNACGIRQRKARRAAMAAAAAQVTNGTNATLSDRPAAAVLKIKVHNKEKQFKKRSKLMMTTTAESSQSQPQGHAQKKNGSFEDFLFNLSKNLATFHRVFPQDEKEAAILLMALSCGLVHG